MLRSSKNTRKAAALTLALGVSACGPRGGGVISPEGFKHSEHAYEVTAAASGQLMSDQWKLDNYYEGTFGYKPKSAPRYVVTYQLDRDGDGEYERNAQELMYDLRFKHLVHDGVIYLRTIPISEDLKHKKLTVLLDGFVEEMAGAGYEVVQFNEETSVVVEKRYAAVVIEEGEAQLGGLPAHAAILDIANLDQIKVDPLARSGRVQLILLHTPFEYGSRGFPVLLLAGYVNQPEDFQAGLPEFHELLSRVVIGGQRGFSAKLTPVTPVSAEPAAPVPTLPVTPADPTPAAAPAVTPDTPVATPPEPAP